MTAKPTIKQIGGDKLATLLHGIRNKAGKEVAVEVGFFESAKYPDGTSVPYVAAIHEFGAPQRKIPSRPFFRNAIPDIIKAVKTIVRAEIDPETMEVDDTTMRRVGLKVAAIVKQSIVDIDTPPHAPSTIAARKRQPKMKRRANRKFSMHSVLIDTAKLRNSVTWRTRHTKAGLRK